MAKIAGKNFREAARAGFTTAEGLTGILVLRTDRRILARYRGDVSTGYRLIGRIKEGVALEEAVLIRLVESHPTWTLTALRQKV